MNIKRIIAGPLLSVIFLIFFAYLISNLQLVFDIGSKHIGAKVDGSELLGSVSSGVQNVLPDVNNNTTFIIENNVTPVIDRKIPVVATINAKSAISVESNLDGTNKIIFDKNSDAKLPIASLTKLMTAAVVLDNYNLSDTWKVDKIADSQASMKQDVKLGDEMTVNSFLEIMLIESSNKSAYTLSEIIGEPKFVELMNQKAQSMGLENTSFFDPTGLSSQDVSTANDLVKLTEYILKNYPKISEISQKKELYIIGFGQVVNTDQLLGEIPEVVCSKTGFTTTAKGCLLLAVKNPKNNDYIINVILGADDRFSEMKKLINWPTTCK